ncbi:hypothetical protein NQ176_g5911 [Zarea fungicola]|uniref:Uncharacterized protein n=1 Tax=Zarea fungicola TaxID=93591 RepID=A0ACC1N778_9HYPO|nr:hypothetical protein NQ176_g5911 [Lecanicillium fungicola]
MMSSGNINHTSFTDWLAAVEHADWNKAETLLAGNVIVNGKAVARHAYIYILQKENIRTKKLEMCIIDDESGDIAARLMHLDTGGSPSLSEQFTEQTLFSFTDGKISTIQSLGALNSTTDRKETDTTAKSASHSGANQEGNLHQFYTNYIDSINNHTMEATFGSFCRDMVTHNHHSYTRDEYREMIESSFEEISGLHFTIERLLVNHQTQRVAARLGFTGVPTKAFRGIQPTGKGVIFSEHAFYQLERGKIKQVWSLLDLEAYRVSIRS